MITTTVLHSTTVHISHKNKWFGSPKTADERILNHYLQPQTRALKGSVGWYQIALGIEFSILYEFQLDLMNLGWFNERNSMQRFYY